MTPLSVLYEGEVGIVKQFDAGPFFVKRMLNIGIYEGSYIKVIKRGCPGPWLVEVNNSFRIALGCNMTNRILIERENI